MNITIKADPSILKETVEIVSRFVNNHTIESSKREFFQKFANQMTDADRQYYEMTFQKLELIEEEGTRGLNPRDPRLVSYFREFQVEGRQQRISLAKILLYSFYEGEGFSFREGLEECRRRYRRFSRDDYSHCRIIDIDAGGLNWTDHDGGEGIPLFRQLDGFELSSGDKWEIYRGLYSYDEALTELEALLTPIAVRMERILEYHRATLEQAVDYWREYFREHSFRDFKTDILGIQNETEPDDDRERTVWFWWMGFGQIHCYQTNGREALNIGILVSRDNMPKSTDFVQGNLLNILKLLGDKNNLQLLQRMMHRRCYGQELATELGLSCGTISKRLNTLLSSGLLTVQRVNNRVYYQTDEAAVRRFLALLSQGLLGQSDNAIERCHGESC